MQVEMVHKRCFETVVKNSTLQRLGHNTVQLKGRNNHFQRIIPVKGRLLRQKVHALDAAMPFDYEAQAQAYMEKMNKLKIGIVGFGNFGQFLAKRLVQHGHDVIATSRGDYGRAAEKMGVKFMKDIDDFCEDHPDIVILSTSILSLERVVTALPTQRLKRNTLFVDVLSVKKFPKVFLRENLPEEADILCTHPMFGPDSGSGSWEGLNFMFEKVRISENQASQRKCEIFLDFFRNEGCNMVEMTCEDHDKDAASTQFITHTVGRMLGAMNCEKTSIDTKGYQSLLSLVENTASDSFELYYGLFMYNPNAAEELEKLEHAFDVVKRQLFSELHRKLRDTHHI